MTRDWTPDYRAAKLARIPLGRLGTPEDVAHAMTFLASPLAAFITGESLNINGGTLMDEGRRISGGLQSHYGLLKPCFARMACPSGEATKSANSFASLGFLPEVITAAG